MRNLNVMLLVVAAPVSFASPDLIAQLASRADREGPEGVNAYLSAHWETAMSQVARRTAGCEVSAVGLSVKLRRGTNVEATQAHAEALREAVGRCPETVLRFANASEVSAVCGLPASVPDSRFESETAKRLAKLKANVALAASANGQACSAAYQAALARARLEPWQADHHVGRPAR